LRGTWRDHVGQWISLLLLGLLATSSWLIAALVPNMEPPSTPRDGSEVSSIVRQAVIHRTGPGGNPQQEVRSARLEQFRDGRSTLSSPVLVHARPEHASVRVVGRQAEISADQNLIRLQGDVLLQRAEFQGSPPVRVQTDRLDYLVDEEIARTSDPVRVQRGQSELIGVGLIANQKTGQLTVLADSRMVIPQAPKTTQRNVGGTRQ